MRFRGREYLCECGAHLKFLEESAGGEWPAQWDFGTTMRCASCGRSVRPTDQNTVPTALEVGESKC